MTTTADDIRATALARYGNEPGAADDITAGTPVILIDAADGRRATGRAIHFLVGPAIRLTDGTHIYATDPTEVMGAYLPGRRGADDTLEAAARRATRTLLAGNTLPVDITRSR